MKLETIVGHRIDQFSVTSDPGRPSDGAVGIEIEIEGVGRGKVLDFWEYVDEGSIMGGVELVSRPLWGTSISAALDEVRILFDETDPYLSFRESIHAHLNVLDLTTDELVTLIKAYVLYEKPLFRLHTCWNRYDNIFCVPAAKSTIVQEAYARVIRDLQAGSVRSAYVPYKYSACNPNPLSSLGTLEFRHMGITENMEELSNWINLLLQLKKGATSGADIHDKQAVFGPYLNQLDIRDSDFREGDTIIEYIELQAGRVI